MSNMKVSQSALASVASVFLLLAFSSCAGTTFQTASSPQVNGIRYYRPASYLLVTPDYDKNSAKVSIFHGPDTSVPYAADPYSWFASNKSQIEFKNGMIDNISSEADSTKFAATTIGAVVAVTKQVLDQIAKEKELAAAIAKSGAAAMLKEPDGKQEIPPPPIFLFMATAQGITQVYPPNKTTGIRSVPTEK